MLATVNIHLGPLGSAEVQVSIFMSWVLMAELGLICLMLRRRLAEPGISRIENVFEMFMETMCDLVREIVRADPEPYVPMVGTLFIFVFLANLMGMFPGLESPTGDLSVTAALAVVVLFSVPFYGIRARGAKAYLRNYLEPNPFMLPFNVLGEITRTLALAVRLFGNIMSGGFMLIIVLGVISGVLRGYAKVFMPVGLLLTLFLSVLSLITAAIQAYIFTVLALVYIGAAVERRPKQKETESPVPQEGAN